MNLNLQNAPVIVGLAAISSNSGLNFDWPKKLQFSELDIPDKQRVVIEEKLQWIKRQFEALCNNPKTSVYAPHVMPYLGLTTIHVRATQSDNFARAVAQEKYPLTYTKNLVNSLNSSLAFKSDSFVHNPASAKGPLISDRNRFRVTNSAPVNELELGFVRYYEMSGLPHAAAFEAWLDLDFTIKHRLLKEAIASGQAEVKYEIEAILEPQLLMEGVASGLFKVEAIQSPTPGHGYALPKNLADGGMLERCFDASNEMYDLVIKSSPEAAPLLCLWGHRQRALLQLDQLAVTSLKHVKRSRLGRLAKILLDKLSDKHPTFIKEFGTTELIQGESEQDEH